MSFLPLLFSGVVSLVSSQNHIPFRRSLSCNRQNKKADTQRHQKSAGALLPLQNDVLCNGFEIQRRDCLFIRSLADSTKKHRVQTAVFSLSTSQALGGLCRIPNQNILYSVVILFQGHLYYIKTLAGNQVFFSGGLYKLGESKNNIKLWCDLDIDLPYFYRPKQQVVLHLQLFPACIWGSRGESFSSPYLL